MVVAPMGQYANPVEGSGREVVFSTESVNRIKQQWIKPNHSPGIFVSLRQ